MEDNLPVRQIVRYSLIVSLTIAFVTILGSFLQDESWLVVSYRVTGSFTLFFVFCLINLGILVLFTKKTACASAESAISNRKVYLTGLIISFIVFLLYHLFNEYLVKVGILPKAFLGRELKRMTAFKYVIVPILGTIMYTIVYFLHNFIILQSWKAKTEVEYSALKAAQSETINELLKQQIQPHFLFNALNVLKSLIRKYPDTAEEYLLRLSDFLRASVNQNKKTVATLSDEIKICDDYMEMQKIRFGNAILYDFEIEESEDLLLPVFSLQPLLENAIKHNELTTASPLYIKIKQANRWISVKNNIQTKKIILESSGNGLSNLTERYRILSGEQIFISENKEEFEVKIKLLHASDLLINATI